MAWSIAEGVQPADEGKVEVIENGATTGTYVMPIDITHDVALSLADGDYFNNIATLGQIQSVLATLLNTDDTSYPKYFVIRIQN